MTKSKSYQVQAQADGNGRHTYQNPTFQIDDDEVDKRRGVSIQNDELENDDHKIPLDVLLNRYGSSCTRGLSDSQVVANGEKYGRNVLQPVKKPSIVWRFLISIVAGLNALLWLCLILAFGSFGAQYLFPGTVAWDNFYLGCALAVVITVSGTFTFYQEYKSDKVMESFKNMVPRYTNAYRNGRRVELEAGELVVGDIIEVKGGDVIPADIRILEALDFKVDNSSLTGESKPCKRSPNCTHDSVLETKNLAFFSTNAVEGACKAICIKVGSNTFMGRLATLATVVDQTSTPIKVEMDFFIKVMTIRSLIFGGVFFCVGLFMNYTIFNCVFFVIGIIVANVPEGLAVTFTMVLTITARRMAKKNCLVKHLHAVEALGSTSVICTDKTGTLTQNKMSVAHLWFNDEIGEADTSESFSGKRFDNDDLGFKALSNVACLCSRASFKPGQESLPIIKREVEGDSSEGAILKFMETQKGSVEKYRQNRPKLYEIPFNSTNKYQISVHDMRNPNDSRHLLVMKGAPETIIAHCKTVLIRDREYDLDDDWRNKLDWAYQQFGSLGERVLGFCDCMLPLDRFPVGYEFDPEKLEFMDVGFRFVGLMALVDPPKAAVPEAVAKCRGAGIKIVMVTGDHPVTAKAIAKSVGIITEGNPTIEEMAMSLGCSIDAIDPSTIKAAVISGAELKLLSPDQLRNVLQNHDEIVFARTSPEQKYDIVEAFQDLGHVVAATGDGVNDSPALKKADIGVAMGITGSEVSKETADLVLMDDNFATIVTGVEEGRLIFDNLKKLIQYNMSDNIAEMYSVMVFMIFGIPLPMGTIAMLLSVCVTDCLPAISLAHETAEADIMKLKPRDSQKDKLLTAQLLRYMYLQTSVIEVVSGFFTWIVYYWAHGWNPVILWRIESQFDSNAINDLEDSYGQEWTYAARQNLELSAQTAFFVSIVITQVANVIICKTRRLSLFQKGMTNWLQNWAILLEIGLIVLLTSTPGLNGALKLGAIRPEFWVAPIPFALFMIAYDEVRKLIIRQSAGSFYSKELTT